MEWDEGKSTVKEVLVRRIRGEGNAEGEEEAEEEEEAVEEEEEEEEEELEESDEYDESDSIDQRSAAVRKMLLDIWGGRPRRKTKGEGQTQQNTPRFFRVLFSPHFAFCQI